MILASMNLHGGRRADGTPFDMAAACRQLRADMIVLQETWWPAGRPDPVAAAAHALGHHILRVDLVTATDLRSLGIAAESGRGQWGLAVLTALPACLRVA
jgi:endonuclease/exonuclease/phosphatase family metal-dependent hydrolase